MKKLGISIRANKDDRRALAYTIRDVVPFSPPGPRVGTKRYIKNNMKTIKKTIKL